MRSLRETADGWVLLGERELATGRVRFPAMTDDADWEPVELSGQGELFTWSTIRMPVAGFDPPLDVGYVRLPEGVLVYAPLSVPPGRTPRIGAPVRLQVGRVGTGDDPDRLIYRYELIGEGER